MTLANKITLTRIALIPVLVILMTIGGQGCMIAALVLFILTSVTDFLDGYVARKYNQVTDFGKFVDPLADKLLVTAALCLFVEQGLIAGGLVWIILAREFIITSLRTIAALSAKYRKVVFSDEIFANDAFDGRTVTPYIAIEEGRPYAMTCISLGKSFNYTGVNHADVLIPDAALRERYIAQKYADHFGSIGPFEYTSVMAAYTPEGRDWQQKSLAYMDGNRRIVEDFFRSRLAPNKVYPMEGAFVGFIQWRGLKLTGEALHRFLEKEAMAVLEPGDHYAQAYAGYSRISLGSTHEQTLALLERIEAAIRRHPEVLA